MKGIGRLLSTCSATVTKGEPDIEKYVHDLIGIEQRAPRAPAQTLIDLGENLGYGVRLHILPDRWDAVETGDTIRYFRCILLTWYPVEDSHGRTVPLTYQGRVGVSESVFIFTY